MIDPFTAPGTKVACINDSPCKIWGLSPLKRGAVYTIDRWEDETYLKLIEFPAVSFGRFQFSRELFQRLDLPEVLTSLLEPVRVPTQEIEPA